MNKRVCRFSAGELDEGVSATVSRLQESYTKVSFGQYTLAGLKISHANPSLAAIKVLADAFGISLSELFENI